MTPLCYRRHRFPPEIIQHAIWLYLRFTLSYRDVEERLCQLSRLLIDDVSAILPRAQAVSRMPSAIAALRMCWWRRVAAGTRWRMRDRQRRQFRSSSWPQQYRLADPVLFNPSIGGHRPLMPR